ncbi:SCO family protein [Aestuariirhabdus sp. Z084]|uniref:SCO family protein n=1 Tax=Aestuariirhabdus haliotis TaxID=2918751 RepID=UPI00201B4593|nr:SCO family protein [Aestuariirhabdus haliotis]MCL6416930.1 SCO family protein [Aestuariirhabdus haliotis]MCL6420908.1 SCO family protein [Aestuariirhabdus haliotis]
MGISRQQHRIVLGAFLLLVIGFVPAALWLGQWAALSWDKPPLSGSLDFQWFDTTNQAHNLSAWEDGYTYLFFGFFSCSQICPVRTHQMQTLERSLAQNTELNLPPVRFLFITIDPGTDTPKMRYEMIDSLSDRFFSARLEPRELSRIQHRLREKVSTLPTIPRHAGNLYLVGPDQSIKRIYSRTNIDNQWLLNDLQKIVISAG